MNIDTDKIPPAQICAGDRLELNGTYNLSTDCEKKAIIDVEMLEELYSNVSRETSSAKRRKMREKLRNLDDDSISETDAIKKYFEIIKKEYNWLNFQEKVKHLTDFLKTANLESTE
jgi:hypothetical protein